MDFKVIASTFAVVFLAELADKTQLATFGLAASSGSRWSVFLGSALALVTSSAIAVVGASALARVLPPQILLRLAGVLLVVMGVVTLVGAGRLDAASLKSATTAGQGAQGATAAPGITEDTND
ncbi:MAG: TMEM165/GDT1 family protein [Myxococcota bacterium]